MSFDPALDPAVAEAIRAHALGDFPNEACGVVTAEGYARLENRSANPEHEFDCDAELAPLLRAGAALALVHSHPGGPPGPSAYDMAQQIAMDVPWGLVACDATGALPVFFWSDALVPPPLLGRPFRYGPSGSDGRGDCAALVRDYYRTERGVRLKEFPRENHSWLAPGVSYRDNLLATGFAPADSRAPEAGDVFVAAIRSRAPNHAGVYLGGGLVLHHLQDRLSSVDPAVVWMRFVTDWLRHGG